MTLENIAQRLGLRVLAGFAIALAAIFCMQVVFGVGIKWVMDWLAASANIRTFVGVTLSRGGILIVYLWISAIGLQRVSGLRLSQVGFRFHAGWWLDLLFGGLLTLTCMTVLFIVQVANGWLIVEVWIWQSVSLDAWLREVWISLLSNLDAGVGEEVVFRGFLLTGLVHAWGKWKGLVLVVILFSLVHLTVAGAEQTNGVLFTVLLMLPGFMLGWAYLRTGSLWLPIAIHFTWDIAYDIFNFTGGSHPGLFGAITRQQGPGWIVGTAYGIEVGLAGILMVLFVLFGVWAWTSSRSLQLRYRILCG